MKAGDVVKYFEGGRAFNALVFHSHQMPDHAGEDGEPLLHLVVVDDNPPRAGIDPAAPFAGKPEQKVRYVFDVVHASHEYSDEYKKSHGLPVGDDEASRVRAAAGAGSGRWEEIEEDFRTQQLRRDYVAVAKQRNDAQQTAKDLQAQNSELMEKLSNYEKPGATAPTPTAPTPEGGDTSSN